MKKFMMFSSAFAIALTAAAAAVADPVPTFEPFNSVNTLGIQRTAKGQNSTVVAVPFQAVGGGDVSLKDTLYTDNLSLADTVMAMQNASGGYYTQWIWLPGLMTDLYWTQRRNGEAEVLPGDQKLSRGVGLKLNLAKSSVPVYTIGDYSEETKTIVLKARTYTFLANPWISKQLDLNVVFAGVSTSDRIYIQNGSTEIEYRYDANGDGNGHYWYLPRTNRYIDEENNLIKEETLKDFGVPLIESGVGFRYYRGARSDLTVNL